MAPLKLTSPSFEPQGAIPRRHTCQREDTSPALAGHVLASAALVGRSDKR